MQAELVRVDLLLQAQRVVGGSNSAAMLLWLRGSVGITVHEKSIDDRAVLRLRAQQARLAEELDIELGDNAQNDPRYATGLGELAAAMVATYEQQVEEAQFLLRLLIDARVQEEAGKEATKLNMRIIKKRT